MTRLIGVFAAAAAVFFASGAVAQEQKPCGPRADVLASFLKQYNEGPVAYGGVDATHIIELLQSSEDTWTILQTDVNGQSCVMATGTGWDVTAEPPLPGDPA